MFNPHGIVTSRVIEPACGVSNAGIAERLALWKVPCGRTFLFEQEML